ncbi:hypothetical protein EHS25_006909 [Saitozyma podzolica]|uniref:Uncharacterized protein n=1 Tax=Saitozyma podzolica TaxID=1890683 RepID=A0A427XRD9_9TREE|nr:hypothetical protein EHS25_006909 [Saitozyma podzolica]
MTSYTVDPHASPPLRERFARGDVSTPSRAIRTLTLDPVLSVPIRVQARGLGWEKEQSESVG